MKRILLFIACMVFSILRIFGLQNTDLSEFKRHEVTSQEYKFSDNWEKITKDDAKLYLYYKTFDFNGECVISNVYYVLERNNLKNILGGFNLQKGFFNSTEKSISRRKSVDVNSDFWKSKLKGFSMSILENPFLVSGMALDSKNVLYETEVMEMLEIDPNTLELKEWYPQ